MSDRGSDFIPRIADAVEKGGKLEKQREGILGVLEVFHRMRRDYVDDHIEQSGNEVMTEDFKALERSVWKMLLSRDPSAKMLAQALASLSYDRVEANSLFDEAVHLFFERIEDENGRARIDAIRTARTAINSRVHMNEGHRKELVARMDVLLAGASPK